MNPNRRGLNILANAAVREQKKRVTEGFPLQMETLRIMESSPETADYFMQYIKTMRPTDQVEILNGFTRLRNAVAKEQGTNKERRLFAAYDRAFLRQLQRQQQAPYRSSSTRTAKK